MWQRLQTLYLGIGLALVIALFFCNFITYDDVTAAGEQVTEILKYRLMRLPLYIILMVLILLLQIAALLGFKVRMVQMWLAIFTGLNLLGLQSIIVFDLVSFIKNAETAGVSYHVSYVTAIFPTIVAILDFLASKNIFLDEAMVQSASRLRSARRKK